MQISATTISLNIDDVPASSAFFTEHLGFTQNHADDGFASLGRQDSGVDIVLLRRGLEALPEDFRDQKAAGLIVAFTVADIAAEHDRLVKSGVEITMPLRQEAWGEKLFQITDPSGIIVQFVEWVTP